MSTNGIQPDALQAALAMLQACGDAFCDSHFTCDEAEVIYAAYLAFGLSAEASRFLDSHGQDDVEPDDDHYTPPPPENLPRQG